MSPETCPHNSPRANPADFKKLYERNRPPVFRYIHGLTGGPQEDVEDLTARRFLHAWKARHRFEGDAGSASGWLIRIAKRPVIDRLYRPTLQVTRDLQLDPPVESTPEQAAIAESMR